MVRLIMGGKGSGKTKQLIEMVNAASKEEAGCVVCFEASRNQYEETAGFSLLRIPVLHARGCFLIRNVL